MIFTKIKKWINNLSIFNIKDNKVPKCECGGDCFVERPAAINFGIGRFGVHIFNHKKDVYSEYCFECFMDIEKEPMREVAHMAFVDGYNRCVEDNGF